MIPTHSYQPPYNSRWEYQIEAYDAKHRWIVVAHGTVGSK